jgi:hypothetical protein
MLPVTDLLQSLRKWQKRSASLNTKRFASDRGPSRSYSSQNRMGRPKNLASTSSGVFRKFWGATIRKCLTIQAEPEDISMLAIHVIFEPRVSIDARQDFLQLLCAECARIKAIVETEARI